MKYVFRLRNRFQKIDIKKISKRLFFFTKFCYKRDYKLFFQVKNYVFEYPNILRVREYPNVSYSMHKNI